MSHAQDVSRNDRADEDLLAVLPGAAGFLNPAHLAPGAFLELREWLSASPSRPFVVRDFLEPGTARAMSAAMRALPVWTRCVTAFHSETETRDIPEAEWPKHPKRAACHYVARDLPRALADGAMDPAHQSVLRDFLTRAVLSDTLRTWITRGTGVPLNAKDTSLELASYGPGDQIRFHQDLLPHRVFAVNFYLDETHRPGSGGRLAYRNEEGTESTVEPLFNSFSIIQIRPDAWHRVEPYDGTGIGRFTVSVGLHRAE